MSLGKKGFFRLFGLLIVFTLFVGIFMSLSAPIVDAQSRSNPDEEPLEFEGAAPSSGSSAASDFFKKRYDLWKSGTYVERTTVTYTDDAGRTRTRSVYAGDEEKIGLLGETLKWLLLILVIVMSYSALASIDFPHNFLFRFVASVIVGFLATFLITTEELITALNSYTALGVVFSVVIPIIILTGFTVLISRKAKAAGIYTQRLLWAVFALWLLFKSIILLLAKIWYDPKTGVIMNLPNVWDWLDKTVFFILKSVSSRELLGTATAQDPVLLAVNIGLALFALGSFVWNKDLVDKLNRMAIDADSQARADTMSRANREQQMMADQNRGGEDA